jgi:hypothetical protein
MVVFEYEPRPYTQLELNESKKTLKAVFGRSLFLLNRELEN